MRIQRQHNTPDVNRRFRRGEGATPDSGVAGRSQEEERGADAEAMAAPLRVRQITAADLPGFLKPFKAEVDFIAIEYGLWDLEWWLPRREVARGIVQVSRFRIPLSYERAYDDYAVRGDVVAAGSAPDPAPCLTEVRYEASTVDAAADSIRQLRTDAERRRREAWSQALRRARGDSVGVPSFSPMSRGRDRAPASRRAERCPPSVSAQRC
jgi:hypothetical protein